MSPAVSPFRIVRCVASPGGDDAVFTALVTGETCDFVLSAIPPSAPVDRTAGVTTVTLDRNGIRRLNQVAAGVGPDDPRRAPAQAVRDALREIVRRPGPAAGPVPEAASCPEPAVLVGGPAGGGR